MLIKWKNYTIVCTVAVCCKGTYNIIDEFETLREAKKDYSQNDFDFWWLAAETINDYNDVNPACWGKAKKEALSKLKKTLS